MKNNFFCVNDLFIFAITKITLMKIDLLNSEGPIISASISEGGIILSFYGSYRTTKISNDLFVDFIYGKTSLESPTGEIYDYMSYSDSMKPSPDDLKEFLVKIGKNMEIERKWLLYKLPDLPDSVVKNAKAKNIVQIYTDKGRFRSETWVDPDGEVKTKYTHTIKRKIAPGIIDEDEKEIQDAEFVTAFTENDGYINKQRLEWNEGDVKWFLDVLEIHGTMLLEAEVPFPEYSLNIPEYLQESIFAEVTDDKRFYNRTLRIKA